jgi:cytochrome bd-type quinol oxidase subunit 2
MFSFASDLYIYILASFLAYSILIYYIFIFDIKKKKEEEERYNIGKSLAR